MCVCVREREVFDIFSIVFFAVLRFYDSPGFLNRELLLTAFSSRTDC